MHTIYLDVLLILTLYVNWLLLRGTARLTHTALRSVRCLLGAAVGSLTALTIFLPELPLLPGLLLKVVCGLLPTAVAFGVRRRRIFWRNAAVFFGISFVFAGLLLAVCTWLDTDLLLWSGSCIYLHFSLTTLILCTACSYFLLRLVSYLRLRTHHGGDTYEIHVRMGIHTAVQHAIADTGNNLTDLFSGRPVILFSETVLAAMPSVYTLPQKLPGYHKIPYATVAGNDWMPVFRPDEVCIRNLSTGTLQPVDALVGLLPEQSHAIFNPNLLHLL